MAIQTVILLDQPEPSGDMQRLLHAETGNRFLAGKLLMNYLRSLMGGARQAKVIVGVAAVKAAGTLTLVSAIATDAISINGVSFTGVASGATGDQFNIGLDDTETAANLAAAINASVTALVSGYVTASSLLGVVTVTAALPGVLGNAITLASADATITASGARLTGGTAGTEKTHYYGSAS